MRNPWLDIPLAEYESHMALPQVAQARLLANVFEGMLKAYGPQSVAVLGCAGGNGFERISGASTRRVVGVDINPAYVQELRARFQQRITKLDLIVSDVQSESLSFPPVEFMFAALVLEYVDVTIALKRLRPLLTAGGILGTLVQLPDSALSTVTPSRFQSIQALAPFMRLVPPAQLKDLAERTGFEEIASWPEKSPSGKQFPVQAFRLLAPDAYSPT